MIASTNARTVNDGVWVYAGSASPPTISTAQSKFGGSSLLFTSASSQYLTAKNGAWCNFTGDFTIDCWVRLPTIGGVHAIYTIGSSTTANELMLRVQPSVQAFRLLPSC